MAGMSLMRKTLRRPSSIASALSLILALSASLFLALWPCSYEGVEATAVVSPGVGLPQRASEAVPVRHLCASLIDVNGPRVLTVLALPVGIAGVGVLLAHFGLRKALWLTAVLLLLFCLIGAFSIGLFYLPSAVALLVAAALHRAEAGSRSGLEDAR